MVTRPTTSAPESVSRILLELWVGIDLRLRNRHQDTVGIRHRLERPRCGRVQTVPNEILSPLGFTGELEEPLLKDLRAELRLRSRRDRLHGVEDAGADDVGVRERRP